MACRRAQRQRAHQMVDDGARVVARDMRHEVLEVATGGVVGPVRNAADRCERDAVIVADLRHRRALHLVLAALAMVAGTGLLLLQLKTRQRLGMPGVRVTNVPLLGEKGLSGRTHSAA